MVTCKIAEKTFDGETLTLGEVLISFVFFLSMCFYVQLATSIQLVKYEIACPAFVSGSIQDLALLFLMGITLLAAFKDRCIWMYPDSMCKGVLKPSHIRLVLIATIFTVSFIAAGLLTKSISNQILLLSVINTLIAIIIEFYVIRPFIPKSKSEE